ncbi:MAG TPA: sensor histidine kinase, partial [Polyangiaceae bacterium]
VVLDLTLAPALPSTKLDERAIEIAVINLVDNALKYAPGGERIAISVQPVDRFIEIAVTDQGPGIPIEDRKRVFERFERGKAPVAVRGSGIGLALVKHIAEAHGGSATVAVALPQGSRFSITLRADPKSSVASSAPRPSQAPA